MFLTHHHRGRIWAMNFFYFFLVHDLESKSNHVLLPRGLYCKSPLGASPCTSNSSSVPPKMTVISLFTMGERVGESGWDARSK